PGNPAHTFLQPVLSQIHPPGGFLSGKLHPHMQSTREPITGVSVFSWQAQMSLIQGHPTPAKGWKVLHKKTVFSSFHHLPNLPHSLFLPEEGRQKSEDRRRKTEVR